MRIRVRWNRIWKKQHRRVEWAMRYIEITIISSLIEPPLFWYKISNELTSKFLVRVYSLEDAGQSLMCYKLGDD